ncbi:MAG: hypothetical protein Q7J85_08280 [Bacillota bacterium]|nr:hypothetical protein [Bacillota bacterium]
MKIISIRKGFASDHSSTSYEFLAIDRPLDKKARAAVSSLSSRAHPTPRSVSFIYHADGYDIPGGWEPLMRNYYDVMYSESYDWWQLVIAFPLPPQQQEELMKYSFDGVEDMGVDVSIYGERAVVTINCRLQPFGPYYNEPWESFDAEDDEDDNNPEAELDVETNDSLLLLLTKIREQLRKGDYRALYEVWKKYAYPEDEDEEDEEEWPKPPVPKEKDTGEEIIAEFAGMLDLI